MNEIIAGYIRWSTAEQSKGETKEVQQKSIQGYVKRYFPDTQIEWYIDDGQSGAFHERPAINRMLQDAEDGRINKIICQRIDRFARDEKVGFLLEERFKQLGVALISVEGINPKDDDDLSAQLMRGIEFLFAGHDKKATAKKLREARLHKNMRGIYSSGGTLLWGYYREPRKSPNDGGDRIILTDPEKKKIWHEIKHMIVQYNYTLDKVCDWINESGIPTTNGNKWSTPKLSFMLKNPALYGEFYANKYRYKLCVTREAKKRSKLIGLKPKDEWIKIPIKEPIFTKEEFFEIRNALGARERKGRKRKGEKFLIEKGLLKCGVCGGKIIPITGQYSERKGKAKTYYGCYWRGTSDHDLKRCGKQRCTLPYVESEGVDKFIWQTMILDIIHDERVFDAFLDKTSNSKAEKALTKDIDELQAKLEDQNKKLERLIDLYENNGIDLEKYFSRKAAREIEIEKIRSLINKKVEDLKKAQNTLIDPEKLRLIGREILESRNWKQLDAEENLNKLPFEKKKDLIKYLYKDVNFKLSPMKIEQANEAKQEWLVDEDMIGPPFCLPFWFNRGATIGVGIDWDGYVEADKLLNLIKNLDTIHMFNIQDACQHSAAHDLRRVARNHQDSQRDGTA